MNRIEASHTTVFVVGDNGSIRESSLHDLIMASVRETTTPLGVGAVVHKREADDGTFEIWTWGFAGNFPKQLQSGLTESEADDELFEAASIDFNRDVNGPAWFWSRAEAEAFVKELAE